MNKWKWILVMAVVLIIGTTPVLGEPYVELVPEMSTVQVMIEEEVCIPESCTEGFLWKDSVYVPVRFVMESLGAQIGWNAMSKSVHIELETTFPQTSVKEPDEETKRSSEVTDWINTEVVLLKAEAAVAQLTTFDGLLDLAYDMYDTAGDVNWIQQVSSGKAKELKNEMSKLNQEILDYHEHNAKVHEQPQRYMQLAKKLLDAASFYEMSSQALLRYVDNNSNSEKKTFLLYRFFALEQIDSITKDLLELQIELEQQKN